MSKCYLRQQAVRETEVTHKEAGCLVGEKQSAGDLPFTNTHQKKSEGNYARKKMFVIKIVVEILIFIHPVHICLIHELQRKICKYVSASCQSNTDIRRQLCSSKNNKMDSGLKHIGFQPTKSKSHVHGESEFSEQN